MTDTEGFGAGKILFLPLVLPSCLQGWVDMKITDNLCKEWRTMIASYVTDTNHQQILWLCLQNTSASAFGPFLTTPAVVSLISPG